MPVRRFQTVAWGEPGKQAADTLRRNRLHPGCPLRKRDTGDDAPPDAAGGGDRLPGDGRAGPCQSRPCRRGVLLADVRTADRARPGGEAACWLRLHAEDGTCIDMGTGSAGCTDRKPYADGSEPDGSQGQDPPPHPEGDPQLKHGKMHRGG